MSINKQELIGKIHQIEGLSNDEKSALIELLKTHKKYGLVWEDKPEEVEERLREELPVLTEVKERAIISDDPDAPNHILIEGDNLEALTALSYTHAGKIDVIYIDPPYNTGNKDFVYNDSFVDSEDSFRHSKWLSFINKRLKIAKQLLSDKGVIFISIDENEEAQLKMLADEICGNNNYLGTLTWESTTQPINVGKAKFQLQKKTEWILCYAKNKGKKEDFILRIQNNSAKTYSYRGKLGCCRLEIIEKSDAGQYKRDSMKFSILGHYPRPGKLWQIGIDTANRLIENNRIEIDNGIVKKAIYPEDETESVKYIPFWSLLGADSVGSALKGKEELNIIMGSNVGFDTVKPIELLKELLVHFNNKVTILDFFAGSGTTLHAAMKLNAEDGGHRKCILVTNNENQICEEVTYERNKRVINGYTTPKGEEVQGLTANSLRYYKTDFIGRDRTSRNMRQLVYAATDMLCIKEDIYREVKTFGSLKLKASVSRYFEEGSRRMLVIYNELAVPAFAEEISKMNVDGKILIYVFAPGNYAYDDEFVDVLDKVELCALPAAIYNAYQKVLPKRKTKFLDGTVGEGASPELSEDGGDELNLIFGEE